jgi:hypothetical protein
MSKQKLSFVKNYYSVLAEDDVVSGLLQPYGDCAQVSLNREDCAQVSLNNGVCAAAIHPPVPNPIGLDTVCVLEPNHLLGSSMTIDSYISKQIYDESEKYRKTDEGWSLVGEMDVIEGARRFSKKCFYEYVHKMLTDKSVGYHMYIEYPDNLYNYIVCNITGVMKKMGICLDYRLYKAATLEYFERKVPLVAKNSQEVKALKEVWMNIYLLDEDRGMCDMIHNLILPIFVEQRMAELHKLKNLYIDYRQKLYRYESFERLDDGEMKIQDFEFIEPKDGWINGNFNDYLYY